MRTAIIGATGYAGAELVRRVYQHPHLRLGPLCGRRRAGEPIAQVLPALAGLLEGEIRSFDADAIADDADLAFVALPHGHSAGVSAALRSRGLRVVDLSADFRLDSSEVYATWYGEHGAPELFGTAVYGLAELNREALVDAEFIAVPGCYPTASVLALAPLLKAGLIAKEGMIIDAKSGVSGAGRDASRATHLPECAEGMRAYKVGGLHRHTPEIEQELSKVAGASVQLSFTPHLVPFTRGLLVTAYATARDATAEACTAAARELYADSPSVAVLDSRTPDTLHVRGGNRAHLAYAVDERCSRVIAMCAIDNLIKGAAGQAVQAANISLAFDEAAGIGGPGMWP